MTNTNWWVSVTWGTQCCLICNFLSESLTSGPTHYINVAQRIFIQTLLVSFFTELIAFLCMWYTVVQNIFSFSSLSWFWPFVNLACNLLGSYRLPSKSFFWPPIDAFHWKVRQSNFPPESVSQFLCSGVVGKSESQLGHLGYALHVKWQLGPTGEASADTS